MSLQLDPPSRLMAMAAPVPVPAVQVMFWAEPTCQSSPPLGAVTVGSPHVVPHVVLHVVLHVAVPAQV